MSARPSPVRRAALALLWGAVASALVAGFAAVVAGAIFASLTAAGTELGEVQRAVWWALARAIGLTALLPLAAITLAAWWMLTAWRPGADASWAALAAGVCGIAAAAFPAVGAWCFTAWQAQSLFDYVATWGLVAGGVAAALLLARRMVPALAPGALGAPPEPPIPG